MENLAIFAPIMNFFEAVNVWVGANKQWAAAVIFVLAFVESIALFSLLVPAWGIMVALGGFVVTGAISLYPVWIAGSIGAALGDWVSYYLGEKYGAAIFKIYPLNKHPEWEAMGRRFFNRFGWLSIVIGRFSGPLRAVVPLVAGMCKMPFLSFQLANYFSAFLWVYILLNIVPLAGEGFDVLKTIWMKISAL